MRIILLLVLATCASLSHSHPIRDGIAGGVDMRILPFGDSITFGQASEDGNGYRLGLYNKLSRTTKVDYLGSIEHGTMEKNRNEGHQGYDIELIREKGMPDLSQRPNVILLMLGTNNIVRNVNREKAPELLSDLIQFLIEHCPDAAILVGTITPLHEPLFEVQRVEYNNALPNVIRKFSENGKHVALVDMDAVKLEHINNFDKVHPTDEGYKVLAQAWYQAIVDAASKGWINPPIDTTAHVVQPNSTEQSNHTYQVSPDKQPGVSLDPDQEPMTPTEPDPKTESDTPTANPHDEAIEIVQEIVGSVDKPSSGSSLFTYHQEIPYHLHQHSDSISLYLVPCSLALALFYVLRRKRHRLRHLL